MRRSTQTLRLPRSSAPVIPDEQRAEFQQLSADVQAAVRGEWTEALCWRWLTDPELRAVLADYDVEKVG